MTKLALVLALAAAYGVGFWTGTKPQTSAASTRAASKNQVETKRGGVARESAAPRTQPAKDFQEALNAIGAGEAPRKDAENGATFAKLIQDCRKVEDDWNARTILGKAARVYAQPNYEELRDQFHDQLSGMLATSQHWYAESSFSIDGDTLTVHAYMDFYVPSPNEVRMTNEPCWKFEARYLRSGAWNNLGMSSGCTMSLDISPDGRPVLQMSTYWQKTLGSLISSLIFPMDMQNGKVLEVLPAVSGEWMKVPIEFKPVTEVDVAEAQKLDAEKEDRSPASE